MSEEKNEVQVMWDELKDLVGAVELDVLKNAKGVAAAGVRARKGLRELSARSRLLVKKTVELDKEKKADKPAKKAHKA